MNGSSDHQVRLEGSKSLVSYEMLLKLSLIFWPIIQQTLLMSLMMMRRIMIQELKQATIGRVQVLN